MPRAKDSAFLNVPYDRSYEERFLAYIAGLSAFGVNPRGPFESTAAARKHRIYRDLKDASVSFRKKAGAGSLFEARIFAQLVVGARQLAARVISTLREP